MTPRDLMARTAAIGAIGAAFYFRPETVAAGKQHGLDGFRFYFLGRGGVLGDVEAQVVASAFGYFEPGLVAKMWTTAKEKMPPRDAGRLYLHCCHELGRSRLTALDGLDEFCAAAAEVNAGIDPAALALYAAVDAEAVPEDAPARALHLCTVLREARGGIHLLALVASGLSPRAAHQIKRPSDVALFGWRDEVTVTAEDRQRWAAAEDLTDRLLEPAYARLDADGQRALIDGLAGIGAALEPAG